MNHSHFRWFWLTAIVMLVDQASKYWAEHILGREVIPLFFWFDFELAHNRGAAFGFLNDAGGWQNVFFGSLAITVSLVLVFMIKALKPQERHLAVAYCLIIAGALGNALDRVFYHYVVDFIHWFYLDWHFPNFNVADSAIFIGAVLLICEALGKPFLNIASEDPDK